MPSCSGQRSGLCSPLPGRFSVAECKIADEHLACLDFFLATQGRVARAWPRATNPLAMSPSGQPARKYRLGVNDIAIACFMHAQMLFG
jgi:hypothetical protein